MDDWSSDDEDDDEYTVVDVCTLPAVIICAFVIPLAMGFLILWAVVCMIWGWFETVLTDLIV
jgi:hypothetical protein